MKKFLRFDLKKIVGLQNFSLQKQCKRHQAINHRYELKDSNRVVIKIGSAVITREDECGIALGRFSSIVEQISELQNSGKQILMVTSGAIAFGKQKLAQSVIMSKSLRDAFGEKKDTSKIIDPRACAASGQSGLMALYSAMFSQYGINTAQVLVNKRDFYNEYTRTNLKATLKQLLDLNILPILNTNDAIAPSPEKNVDIQGVISIQDNDSLAARLAVLIKSDLLLIMADVDGLYSDSPGKHESNLLSTFNPNNSHTVNFGNNSQVGSGGMKSKIDAALWTLKNDCSVVICNGAKKNVIIDALNGEDVGTFFTNFNSADQDLTAKMLAIKVREGGKKLLKLTSEDRSAIITDYIQTIKENTCFILEANAIDIKLAKENNLSSVLLNRLLLTENKINSLIDGMYQLAANKNVLGRVLKSSKITNDSILQQITCPIGVLLVIFDSRPELLPQICSLAIISGNALLLKGSSEALNTNKILYQLAQESIEKYVTNSTIFMIDPTEEILDIIKIDSKLIDLVIATGSNKHVKSIKEKCRSIPVISHSEGVCHVYIDEEVDTETAIKIIRDSKCDSPSSFNALDTLLIHENLINTDLFQSLIQMLIEENVKIYSGPNLEKFLKFSPPLAKNLEYSYSNLELTIEMVNDVDKAIEHINTYGSHNTDSIVTTNSGIASKFFKNVDSACVFHNVSTRMSEGYQFGFGGEVGVSTGRIHTRGPIGADGLLTSKWILFGSGETAADFSNGHRVFLHENINI